ncbi:tyrosine-type recombinase/integrase [Specibacter sp. NPDC078692]|uniref:tyrosine-type recombinase/integrase n=1 Tax=Specibacter sp. NPDC078692 TaxID=3155818 RepID=UPI003414F2B8
MTPQAAASRQELFRENPLVLATRPLRPDTVHARLSRFSDDRWDLTPGIFENHGTKIALAFEAFPSKWRLAVKEYFWLLINDETVRPLPAARAESRPSLRTICFARTPLARVLSWASEQGIDRLDQLLPNRLDLLLAHIGTLDLYHGAKSMLISETRRLWAYREVVPEVLRMPESQPWLGELSQDLLGPIPRSPENRTHRVSDETLVPLVSWAMRFVDDFSTDIVASFREYCDLLMQEDRFRPLGVGRPTPGGTRQQRLQLSLNKLKREGLRLPGRTLSDGSREIRWQHLGRLTYTAGIEHAKFDQDMIRRSGLPIDDDAYLATNCRGTIDGEPWRSRPIPFDDVTNIAQHLVTACYILIAYLSGMRPGEVLSLERGCLTFEESNGRWTVFGVQWKGARSSDGAKAVEGKQREVPWVVHPAAARAITVLTHLHTQSLLFPVRIRPQPVRKKEVLFNPRPGRALTTSQVGTDIKEFMDWVNSYCDEAKRPDRIPEDENGRVSPNRFRRTLAWHIVRQPRGLVAAAIQYGHVATQITQGYAGNYASGFLDELALERWLERIENVRELEEYLDSGGHVSGPSATELETRTHLAQAKFGGRVIPTGRQAEKLIQDPLLQVFKGRGMHCVFNKSTALCTKESDDEPALGECRSACSNIARTDEDILDLRTEISSLPSDPLAPEIRNHRITSISKTMTNAIDRHEGNYDDSV